MSIKFHKIISILVILLFWSLPLINSRLFEFIWIDLWLTVSWNYEFTKVMFFNIFSSIIIIYYLLCLYVYKTGLKTTKNLNLFLIWFWGLIFISTLLSSSSLISFFWNTSKAHWFLMWNNIIWISYILYNILDEKIFQKINLSLVISAVFISIIWIKELYFPSFEYWDLSNRLLSTFWHPNYVALFLLLILPYIFEVKIKTKNIIKKYVYCFIWMFLFISLLLTKSAIGIFLSIIYLLHRFIPFSSKYKYIWWIPLILIWAVLIFKFYPEKIHSFISRFYVWETTLRIIFSDIKILFFWVWFENIIHYFDNYKSEYLYVFENIGYTSDRPHNIFLQFFVHLWIWWLWFISCMYY